MRLLLATLHTPDWLDLLVALITALLTWFASTKVARAGAARRAGQFMDIDMSPRDHQRLASIIKHPRSKRPLDHWKDPKR